MFEKTRENLKTIYEQETFADRRQRMFPAAIAGVLIATAYVWTFFFINVYTIPSLPLGVDWMRLLGMWITFSIVLALFGMIAAWFTEEYLGILGGALIFTVLVGVVLLFLSGGQNPGVSALSIITVVPIFGLSLLGAWTLRWAAHRYLAIKQDQTSSDRRKRLAKHIATIILIGLIPGILTRMDPPSVQALRELHELLQAAPNDPSVRPRLPLERIPALQDHFGMDYLIYSRSSSHSVGAMDVTVQFSDGFTMTCLVAVGTGASFITQCNEGKELKLEP